MECLRIIGGSKRGLKLIGFEGDSVRPTTDRVKENIFNIIAPYVTDASTLDLFGGTGALSIEALSRGARKAVVCDVAESSLSIIRTNLAKAEFSAAAQVVKADAVQYISATDESFDIIFIDPPYNTDLLEKALAAIAKNPRICPDGIIVCERDYEKELPNLSGLDVVKDKKYGRVQILVLRMPNGE